MKTLFFLATILSTSAFANNADFFAPRPLIPNKAEFTCTFFDGNMIPMTKFILEGEYKITKKYREDFFDVSVALKVLDHPKYTAVLKVKGASYELKYLDDTIASIGSVTAVEGMDYTTSFKLAFNPSGKNRGKFTPNASNQTWIEDCSRVALPDNARFQYLDN
jgi:hypothetical protein